MKKHSYTMLVIYLFFTIISNSLPYPSRVIIKSFSCDSSESGTAARALQFAVDEINEKERNGKPGPSISYNHHSIESGSSEAWHLTDSVCDELKEGAMTLITVDSGRGNEAIRGLADTLEMPMITLTPPAFPPDPPNFFDISVRPSSAELLADFIVRKHWTDIILLSDGEYAGLSMPWLWHHLHQKTNISISAQLLELPLDATKFDLFLQKFSVKRSNFTNRILIDTTSTARLQKFLASIRAAQFSQANFHYVITNFDFLPYDVEMFQNGNINMSGFQLINKESRAYWNLKKHLKKKESNYLNHYDVDARSALAHDAMVVAWKAFSKCLAANDSLFQYSFSQGKYYNRGFPGIYCDPQSDKANPNRPFASFEHGRIIAKALRGLKLGVNDGTLTGLIEFDRFGHRKNYDVSVVDLVSNTKATFNRKEIMAWRQGVGFMNNQTVAQHTRKTVEGRNSSVVRVVTVIVAPFVMYKEECVEHPDSVECRGNKKYEGYCIDLLKLLSDKIEGFNFEVQLGNKTGSKMANGSWDGMIGDLLYGRADIAVSSLTINQERERVVDFSKPFMTTGISIMIKKPDKQEFSVFSFMQPLSTEIWMYIIFAFIGVSVVIFLVSRFSPYEWRVEETAGGGFTISNDFSVYNCLWFTLAAFMQQGTDILPRSVSGRIASSAWWFFSMIIVSTYTANLAAFLTLEKMQAPIESVEDLAKQTKIKYGIQGGGSTAAFFKHSSVQIYQRMWRYMESQVPSVFVATYADGIERVRSSNGRYAFLLEATANEYENTRKPCDTMKVGANLNSVGYGVATPFGSDWKDHLNLAILALQERGELKKLENKWWYDRGQCDQAIAADGSEASLNLSKVAGIFYILIIGMIGSMIAALGECIYTARIEARKANKNSVVANFAKTLKTALFSQLRLSIQGSAVAQPETQPDETLKKQQSVSFLSASCDRENEEKSVIDRDQQRYSPYNTAV